jgi:hypothetical protein
MNTLEQQLDHILADPLRELPADGAALGYVGADIPLELLLASGRRHCHLPWRADRDTPLADQWLESSFPGWARSILEDWARGHFAGFSQVLFTRGDDAVQRLYYYICELRRGGQLAGPEPLIFDIARIPRATSVDHTAASLRKLALRLGIGEAALRAGIVSANQRRAMFERIDAERVTGGSLYEKLARASHFADLDAAMAAATWPAGEPVGRVLLAGSAPPDDRLHRAVEASGWAVTGEHHDRSLQRLGPPIDATAADPVLAIAAQRHATAPGPRGFEDATETLLVAARRARARAVVLWLTREDEALAWRVPAQRNALAAAGLPALILTSRRWDAGDGAADEITRYLKDLT